MRIADHPNDIDDFRRYRSRFFQLIVKRLQLTCRWQFAMHQQVSRLFKAGMLCQFMDRIAVVPQLSCTSVDVSCR